ncbi:hypothetical protein [Escherichia coli]|uniref:hypothetical protein n=1 Tax=Escherichia coli TaxID=562 RepID=UPI0008F4B5F3|nr:hypothetical protein [Escherichia coli]OII78492.1 hypothetical protein BHF00_20940 [Escherichia coli]
MHIADNCRFSVNDGQRSCQFFVEFSGLFFVVCLHDFPTGVSGSGSDMARRGRTATMNALLSVLILAVRMSVITVSVLRSGLAIVISSSSPGCGRTLTPLSVSAGMRAFMMVLKSWRWSTQWNRVMG